MPTVRAASLLETDNLGQAILLRGAKQLLTLRGLSGIRRGTALQDLQIIEDASLLIRDGLIVSLGSARRIENLKEARDAIEIPAQGKVVMPAFADGGLAITREPHPESRNQRRLPISELYVQTREVIRSCIQHGTSSADIKVTGNESELRSVVSTLAQLARIGNNLVDVSPTWRVGTCQLHVSEFSTQFCATIDLLVKRKLVASVELLANDEQTECNLAVLQKLRDTKLHLQVHWPGESTEALALLLAQSEPRCVHAPAHFAAPAVPLLAQNPGIVLIAPGAEIGDEAEMRDTARNLLDAGAAVALSSGYDRFHPNSFSMQMAVALAVLRLKFTPEEAIAAATINAAYATGLGHATGSLEAGKVANVLLLNVSDYREMVRSFGINHVGMVIKNGNVIYNRTGGKIGAK